jgi:type I restriction enzyme, R subunit
MPSRRSRDTTSRVRCSGFEHIEALRDATNVIYTSDETKRRFEILARLVFSRFKALLWTTTKNTN